MDFEGMVEQIPFGLLAGELWNDIGTKKEVRIVKLSESGLVLCQDLVQIKMRGSAS